MSARSVELAGTEAPRLRTIRHLLGPRAAMPLKRILPCVAVLLAVALSAACERAKSANPLSPDVAGPIPGVSITAPMPLEPQAGIELVSDGAPQTLLLQNAGTSGQREIWLQLEVAADANFAQVMHQADRLTPGSDGRTTYRLPEPLGPGHTYYWRARAMDGANTGPYSAVAHFTVIEPTTIEAPTPLAPIGNIDSNRPEFRVRNGQVSGPADGVTYTFEIGTAPDPASIVAVLTATPGSNGTTSVSVGDVPWGRTFYWRVYASDGTITSPFSSGVAFTTPAAPAAPPPAPSPGPTPSPSPGNPGPPLPGGGGGRTPDPQSGRLPAPNMSHVVRQVAAARPDLLRNSCQSHGGSWGFMDLLVKTLRTYDTRWGYNCKRGNCGDVSHDVVDYHWGRGSGEGSNEVYTIDVIGGHCGSNPSPAWGNTQPSGGPGQSRWTCAGKC